MSVSKSRNVKLTDLVLDIVGHAGHLVEKSQRLVHTLLDDTQVGQHLSQTLCFCAVCIWQKQNRIACRCVNYLRSNLGCLLGVHHADVLKVFEGVLPVLLLGAHVLLQQAEDVTGLQMGEERTRQMGQRDAFIYI